MPVSKPRAGQVWWAPSPKLGKRYVRIMEVRSGGGDGGYVNAKEIALDGKALRATKAHPFRKETFAITLNRGGTMPPPYVPMEEES